MSQTWKLFSRWQQERGFASTRQAAMALGVDPSAATLWKNGRNANADIIERLAKDLGENPAVWAALAMEEQSKGETARAWGRIARQLSSAAALAGLFLLVPGTGNAKSFANSTTYDALPAYSLYIMF